MIVIEENNTIHFYRGQTEVSKADGFTYLDKIYSNEPPEVKKVINNLKKKYLRDMRPNE